MKTKLIGRSSVPPFFRSSVLQLCFLGIMFLLSCQKNDPEIRNLETKVEFRNDPSQPDPNPWWDEDGPDWSQLSSECTPTEEYYNCWTGSPPTILLNIQLPQYPGCTFQVAFKYVSCYNPAPTILITDYVMGYINCPAFQTDLYNSSLPGNIGLGQFIYNIDQQIYEKIEQHIIGVIQSSGAPEPCWTLAFFKSSCYMYCYGTNIRNLFVVNKKPCGTNACCKRQVNYCNGVKNGLPSHQIIENGTCSQTFPPAGLCKGILNPVPAPDCYFSCRD